MLLLLHGGYTMILWTKWHAITILPAFAIMIVIALILARVLKDKDEKYKLIPIQIIAVTLVVLEIIKQVNSFANGYDLYHIPLHFCSLFIFFMPLFAFYKGKFQQQIRAFTMVCGAMLFMFMLIYPTMIYSEGNIVNFTNSFGDFHTVAFHNLVCFAFILILALRLYNFDTKRDMKVVLIGYSAYSLVAAVMSQILKTNYNGFYRCGIDAIAQFVDGLKAKIGWPGQLIYVIGMSAATILFGVVCYWLFRGIFALITLIKNAILNKKQTKIKQN